MSCLDHARDAVDLAAPAVNAVRLVEDGVFVEISSIAARRRPGSTLSKHLFEIAKQ